MITYSPTQIDTFLGCQRKWAFRYIDHLETPQHPSAALGTEVHKQLEEYFGPTSRPLDYTVDAGYIAGAMLPHLPMPMERGAFDVEHEFLLQSSRHHYHGLIDLRDRSTCTVYDHKTTSNLAYAKTPEKLLYDPQAILYAMTSMVDWQVPKVKLQWTYSSTRGARRSLPVLQEVDADHALKVFDEIERVADDMDAVRAALCPTISLDPNPRECHRYGGCPYRHICNLGPAQHLQSLTSMDTTESLLDRLTKRAQVAPGQINPPESVQAVPEVAPEPTPPDLPPPEPGTKDISEALKAQEKPTRKVRKPKAENTNAKQQPIGVLYVNCAPTDLFEFTPATRFETLLDQARTTVALTKFRDKAGEPEYGVPDYRFVHFGQGPAVLLAAVQQVIEQQGRIDELVLQDSTTPEAQIVLNHLLSRCERVVRSTR